MQASRRHEHSIHRLFSPCCSLALRPLHNPLSVANFATIATVPAYNAGVARTDDGSRYPSTSKLNIIPPSRKQANTHRVANGWHPHDGGVDLYS
jgi:hypothetical protein